VIDAVATLPGLEDMVAGRSPRAATISSVHRSCSPKIDWRSLLRPPRRGFRDEDSGTVAHILSSATQANVVIAVILLV